MVAAVSHSGDTFDDQTRVLEIWRRTAHLRRLVDYMLNKWQQHTRLHSARVGAFGFSNGGFTVLVAVGGVPDLSKVGPYCHVHPSHDVCQALAHAGVDPDLGKRVPNGAWNADRRIKAAVVAAPAFGFAFGRDGLAGVRVPIQLWGARLDRHQPGSYYEEAVRAALPRRPEYHLVPNAGHYDFLPACDAGLSNRAPEICTSVAWLRPRSVSRGIQS